MDILASKPSNDIELCPVNCASHCRRSDGKCRNASSSRASVWIWF